MVKTDTSSTSGSRRPRNSITPDEIVSGAFELANEVSLTEFSMPMLAKHLDVGLTSIYWHFRKKEDLLDAMTARANREYHAATPFLGAETWQDALRRHFRRMHQTFRQQPVLVELTLLRARARPLERESVDATADKLHSMITAMVAAGFTPTDAVTVYYSLLAHVCGAAMLEQQGVFATGDDTDPSRPDDSMRPSARLSRALSARGHDIVDVDETTFDFTFEAIISRAETMTGR
ncbi:TetR family transcriptional regulator [Gordonia sp. NPDC003425]